MSSPTRLAGNRLVLAGAVLYLLEWVAIVAAGVGVPVGPKASAADVVAAYSGHADALGWAAGWFSVVLLGRVLIVIGLRAALSGSPGCSRLLDVAVVAMTVSVALEVVTYAVAAGAASAASVATTRTLDGIVFQTNLALYGPAGVSLLCAGAAMWRSGLFHRVLAALALVAGAAFTVLGLGFTAPESAGTADALSSAALLFWIWMLWAGVVTWRARGEAEASYRETGSQAELATS